MSKAVLISIRPEWVEKILAGEKTLEVRKNRPRLEPPFKCYIYCTKDEKDSDRLWVLRKKIRSDYYGLAAVCANLEKQPENHILGNGKVVAEFVCDRIDTIKPANEPYGIYDVDDDFVAQTRLVDGALWNYGKGATLYGWHISKLEIYDTPKPLSAFKGLCKIEADCGCCPYYNYTKMDCDGRTIRRPPQSWCYVEDDYCPNCGAKMDLEDDNGT